MGWSTQVMKAQQCIKTLIVFKVETHKKTSRGQHKHLERLHLSRQWAEYMDAILKSSAFENAHLFMYQLSKPLDSAYARESCVDHDTVKLETFFIHNLLP